MSVQQNLEKQLDSESPSNAELFELKKENARISGEVKSLQFPSLGEQLPSPLDVNRLARMRPAQPGISLGHVNITAGTYGATAIDLVTGRRVILSNAHVLTADPRQTTMTDHTVLQPGPHDGGVNPDDKIGETIRWVTLNTEATP